MKNLWRWPIIAVAGLVILSACAAPAEDGDSDASEGSMGAALNEVAATATATPTEPAPSLEGVIEDGTWMVGTEIEPGRYRNTPGASCYWERLSGLGGGLGDILANGLVSSETVVDILPTDLAFKSERCGPWYDDEADVPITVSPEASFGDGTWIVAVDIASGTWRGEGGSSCYWERLADFTGELSAVLANDLPSGPPLVQIAASDTGFATSGCGDWTLVE